MQNLTDSTIAQHNHRYFQIQGWLYLLRFLFAICLLFIVIYIYTALSRISSAEELTWYEYEALVQAQRVLQGKPIYTAPGLEYVPMMYTPLYYYISALFIGLFGESLMVLRSVSFAASLGVMTTLYLFIKKETGSKMYGAVAAGFFAACYVAAGASYDVARVDSVALFLFMLAVYFIRFGKRASDHGTSALLISAAVFAKQTYIFTIPFFFLYYVIYLRKYAVFFIAICFAVLGVGSVIMNSVSDGWFIYYTFFLPTKHRFYDNVLIRFIHVIMTFKYVFAVWLVTLSIIGYSGRWKKAPDVFLFILTSLVFIISVLSTLKVGGSNNVFFPVFGMLGLLFARSMHAISAATANIHARNRRAHYLLLFLLNTFILLLFLYNPVKIVAEGRQKARRDKLVSYIRSVDGPVFVPSNPMSAVRTGKQAGAHIHFIGDLLGLSGDKRHTEEGNKLIYDLRNVIRAGTYRSIIVPTIDKSKNVFTLVKDDLNDNYIFVSEIKEFDYFYKEVFEVYERK